MRLSSSASRDLLRTFLAERALDCDQPVAELEKIAAFCLDAPALCMGAAEYPFRHAALARDVVPALAPTRIGERLEDGLEGRAHSVFSDETRAVDFVPARGIEGAVVGHELHQ